MKKRFFQYVLSKLFGIIKWIVLVLDSDWLSHVQSRCKLLNKHTPVTALH